MSAIREVIDLHRQQLFGLIELRGVMGFRPIYANARTELEQKLGDLARAGRGGTFEAQHLRMILAQVAGTSIRVERGIARHLEAMRPAASNTAGEHLVSAIETLGKSYGHMTPVIPAAEVATIGGMFEGVDPMLLNKYKRSAATYGPLATEQIRKGLAQSLVQRETVDQAVDRISGAHGLFEKQRWIAERVVRTETSYTYGVAKQRSMELLRERSLPKLRKRLVATFDNRTGDDSKQLHGQTVDVTQPFTWHVKDSRGVPTGKVVHYMQPPNRPNDREIVIPWVEGWPASAIGHPGDVEPESPPAP